MMMHPNETGDETKFQIITAPTNLYANLRGTDQNYPVVLLAIRLSTLEKPENPLLFLGTKNLIYQDDENSGEWVESENFRLFYRVK
jgi:hypothetical protein